MVWRCYQDRLASSVAMGVVLGAHNIMRTWWKWIDLYVFPSDFARRQLVSAGLPADRMVVKPHFVEDPGSVSDGSGGALFLGRLEVEKGVLELIETWRWVRGCQLEIIGDGPLKATVQSRLKDPELSHVALTGWLRQEEVASRLSSARLVAVPSLGDESFGLPVIEAFSHGVPVLASSRGALPELVQEGVNGVIADPLDAKGMAQRVCAVVDQPSQWRRLAEGARQSYLHRYGVESAYRTLMDLYERATSWHRSRIKECR
jgi:glycosyltransferase involved in cell wall biosynthesis